eukprot:2903148-Pleurochrysis_carterae.AAC.1
MNAAWLHCSCTTPLSLHSKLHVQCLLKVCVLFAFPLWLLAGHGRGADDRDRAPQAEGALARREPHVAAGRGRAAARVLARAG